jgi:hypothetical protein
MRRIMAQEGIVFREGGRIHSTGNFPTPGGIGQSFCEKSAHRSPRKDTAPDSKFRNRPRTWASLPSGHARLGGSSRASRKGPLPGRVGIHRSVMAQARADFLPDFRTASVMPSDELPHSVFDGVLGVPEGSAVRPPYRVGQPALARRSAGPRRRRQESVGAIGLGAMYSPCPTRFSQNFMLS